MVEAKAASYVLNKATWMSHAADFQASGIAFEAKPLQTFGEPAPSGNEELYVLRVNYPDVPVANEVLIHGMKITAVIAEPPREPAIHLRAEFLAIDRSGFDRAVAHLRRLIKKGQPRNYVPEMTFEIDGQRVPESFFTASNFVWSRTQ